MRSKVLDQDISSLGSQTKKFFQRFLFVCFSEKIMNNFFLEILKSRELCEIVFQYAQLSNCKNCKEKLWTSVHGKTKRSWYNVYCGYNEIYDKISAPPVVLKCYDHYPVSGLQNFFRIWFPGFWILLLSARSSSDTKISFYLKEYLTFCLRAWQMLCPWIPLSEFWRKETLDYTETIQFFLSLHFWLQPEKEHLSFSELEQWFSQLPFQESCSLIFGEKESKFPSFPYWKRTFFSVSSSKGIIQNIPSTVWGPLIWFQLFWLARSDGDFKFSDEEQQRAIEAIFWLLPCGVCRRQSLDRLSQRTSFPQNWFEFLLVHQNEIKRIQNKSLLSSEDVRLRMRQVLHGNSVKICFSLNRYIKAQDNLKKFMTRREKVLFKS